MSGRRRSPVLRGVAWFWGAFLVLAAAGGGTLQWLGPPPHPQAPVVPRPAAVAPPVVPPPPAVVPAVVPARPVGSPIAPPAAALLTPSAAYPGMQLPRIAADGRTPMQVYAGVAPPPDARPRVALLLAGIGPSEADSDDAVRTLPAGITLAISPYTSRPDRLLEAARARGHEFLLSLPMEPMGYPMNDAGQQMLMSAGAPDINAKRLEWSLSRFAGYVGATGALGRLHGERFAASGAAMQAVLDDLATRGLLYVDPRTRPGAGDAGLAAQTPIRAVDLVIDEPPVRTEIDAKLARLEQIARDHGAALGLAGAPTPVTTERLMAWTATLAARGIVLVPVTALMPPVVVRKASP